MSRKRRKKKKGFSVVTGGNSGRKQTGGFFRCYESHPTLKLGSGKLYGGSCHSPQKGHDIYVGLDAGMEMQFARCPWHPEPKDGPVEFLFPIIDMTAPSCEVEFQHLLDYLEENLNAGKSIQVGCIGGHGRTGTVFAALVKQMKGIEDAIVWVRENYCKSAVESQSQVEFLHKHYGIKKVPATKSWGGHMSNWASQGDTFSGLAQSYRGHKRGPGSGYKPPTSKVVENEVILHSKTGKSIWA